MKIKEGTIVKNKTWYYLTPALKGHGEQLINRLNTIYKFAFGIYDYTVKDFDFEKRNLIFILTDKKLLPDTWTEFMEWVRYEPYYVTDYVYYSNNEKNRKHMLVLELPEEYSNAYSKFLEGKYSEMYTEEQLDKLFSEANRESEIYYVLNKDPRASSVLLQVLEAEYDVKSLPDRIKEYDIPLKRIHEVFNYDPSLGHSRYITSRQDLNGKKDLLI